jgi:soluble lytic murein transglycosylase-like protein
MTKPNLVRIFAAAFIGGEALLGGLLALGETESLAKEAPPQQTPNWEGLCHFEPPEGFNQLLVDSAGEFGLHPSILAVTVYRESGCDPWAYGAVGEIGLTQIYPKYWVSDLRKQKILTRSQELWDPRTNLRASAWILSTLLQKEKNKFGMFRRYNGRGPKARKYAAEQQARLWSLTRGHLLLQGQNP